MLSKTLTAVLALAVCALASDPFVIDTPTDVAQCVPTLIVWSGGEPPFSLEILDASTGEPIGDFGGLLGYPDSFTWSTNVPAGEYTASMIDSTGAIAQTAPFPVQPGNDDCTLA